jgi:hypothetical protein
MRDIQQDTDLACIRPDTHNPGGGCGRNWRWIID